MKKISLCLALCLSFFLSSSFVTNPLRDDGFGSQFQTIIYSAIYADLTDQPFYYTPFTKVQHNYDNDPDFLSKAEWIVNFMDYFPLNRDPSLQGDYYITFFESNLEACARSAMLKQIKALFRANKDKSLYFDPNCYNIALHVRRPNPHDNRVYGTHIPDDVFLSIINALRKKISSSKVRFHIYSQGDPEHFEEVYAGKDIVLHINEPLEDTFTSLVLADALVTSPSSFSYTAAILSDGVVFYMPFWHPPLPGWHRL